MVPGAVGRTLPQRAQLRSPGALATPQAGLVQMTGASAPPPASAGSCWSMKPQSMQEMAPGNRSLPQAGHLVEPALGCCGIDGRAKSPMEPLLGLAAAVEPPSATPA